MPMQPGKTGRGSENLPKNLAEFQELRYNKNKEVYQKLQREKRTISAIKNKGWSESFTKKAVESYYEFRKRDIEFTDHGIARFLSRGFSFDEVESIIKRPFNYYQADGKYIKYYDKTAVIFSVDKGAIVSVINRKSAKEDWHEIKN